MIVEGLHPYCYINKISLLIAKSQQFLITTSLSFFNLFLRKSSTSTHLINAHSSVYLIHIVALRIGEVIQLGIRVHRGIFSPHTVPPFLPRVWVGIFSSDYCSENYSMSAMIGSSGEVSEVCNVARIPVMSNISDEIQLCLSFHVIFKLMTNRRGYKPPFPSSAFPLRFGTRYTGSFC